MLLCGTTDLRNESIASKIQLIDQLGRRKLKDQTYAIEESASTADLLWIAPRKYWTCSKNEQSMQDRALKLADVFLAKNKDVVIITSKDFRFKSKEPHKVLHLHETPGHTVLCTRKLSNLIAFCGPSDDEQLLTTAIVQCFVEGSCLGVGQSYESSYKADQPPKENVSSLVFNASNKSAKSNKIPESTDTQQSKRQAKGKSKGRTSKSPDANCQRGKSERKVTFDDDDGAELGDHASNNDIKPNYAKEYAKERNRTKKQIEPSNDDCGEDVSAIEISDSTQFAAFIEEDISTCCPSSDSESEKRESSEVEQIFLQSLDELLLFSDRMLSSDIIPKKIRHVLSAEEQQSFKIAAELEEPYCSHFWATEQPLPLHVMEIFGGYGGVSRIAIRRHLRVGRNFDINLGFDLSREGEQQKLLKYISVHRPTCIVMGPPCTSFSAWARLNKLLYPEAWKKSYTIGKPLAELCAKIAQLQHSQSRYYIIENPWGSAIWSLPSFQQLMSFSHTAYCEQCCFGLVDMNGSPSLKPTAFISNSLDLISNLNAVCGGRHSFHAPLAGKLYGVPKTKFAQRWPHQLCKTIVENVHKVCFQSKNRYTSTTRAKQFLSTCCGNACSCSQTAADPKYTKHEYVFAGSEPATAQTSCPGCKSHAYRRDPRHTRVPGVCKFPDDKSDELTCPACMRNLPSHHPLHNRTPGSCHWAEAMPRLGGGSSSSRGPRPTEHRIPDQALTEPSANTPPRCNLGSWSTVYDSYLLDTLNELSLRDGWHELSDGTKALVLSNTRFTREPEPRFKNSDYTLRSTYARFLEHPHANGTWWQLEEAVHYQGLDRSIGYPVAVLVHVFMPEAGDSPTENKTGIAPPPQFDESATLAPTPKRRAINREPAELPREVEYGEQEAEVPAIPISGRELAVPAPPEELAISKAEEEQAIAKAEQIDWSSVDLGTALRELKSDNKSLATRALRKLHLRWYHAPATRMKIILAKVGVPAEILKLTQDVCDTCRICRAWKRPSSKSATQVTQAEAFNDRVQMDLLYVGEAVIVHLCDEATRFSVADIVKNREPAEILSCIKRSWVKYFGVPKLFVSDSEGALGSEEAAIWAERLDTSFKLLPRNSHATTVERHHETLRQLIHKISEQCRSEGLTISLEDIVSEATVAKNSLLTINGFTPFTAVLGRTPNILPEHERPTVSTLADNVGGQCSKHATRLREIAVASMLEHSAKERIERAKTSQTRVATEQLELKANDLVDIYRTPRTKDNTGWRGPCRVVSAEDGQVNVQWNGRIIACRVQDVRRALMYPVLLQERNEDVAFEMIRKHATGLKDNADTFMIVHTPQGWQLSQAAKQNPVLFQALLKVAFEVFYMPRCIGGRIGRGTTGTKGMLHCDSSILVWWPVSQPQLYKSLMCHGNLNLNLKELLGGQYQDVCWIRLFGVDEEQVAPVRALLDDVPHLAADPPGPVAAVPFDMPFEADDQSMPAGGGDSMSIMSRETRVVTPMQTNSTGRPPPPRPPQRQQRTPIHTDRSRSSFAPSPVHSNISQPQKSSPPLPPSNITPVNTGRTISTILTPNTVSPIHSTDTSQRATTGTITPRQIQSPRGEKRTPELEHTQSPKQHKHHTHSTPASSSTDIPPFPQTTTHEPLLPIHDTETDNETEISDLETLFEPETETNLLAQEKWLDFAFVSTPPTQYHDWELAPGIEELCESQQHYLQYSHVCKDALPTRKGGSKDE